MRPRLKIWLKRFASAFAIAVAVFVLLPLLAKLIGLALGLSFGVIVLAGYAILLVGIPFFLWIMAEAGYRVFLKPSLRARRIRGIRNRRLWREAAARNPTGR